MQCILGVCSIILSTHISYFIPQFYYVWHDALGPYGYEWVDETFVDIPVMQMNVLFRNGTVDPSRKVAHFSDDDYWGKTGIV